ncbi:unnamed protein product [Linum trigynum]|uniref:Uncharacterized protein n=1 Tax=Linum trigynum TaxID=586398 RepID=A0AAV2D557_9ROSI
MGINALWSSGLRGILHLPFSNSCFSSLSSFNAPWVVFTPSPTQLSISQFQFRWLGRQINGLPGFSFSIDPSLTGHRGGWAGVFINIIDLCINLFTIFRDLLAFIAAIGLGDTDGSAGGSSR